MKDLQNKIVLVGGCFDILHVGHIRFLKKAKSWGDILIVLLESDEKIKKLKGKGRPINSQKVRAEVLSSLKDVDIVFPLPKNIENSDYDLIVREIKPDFIAITEGDPNIKFKERAAQQAGAKVKVVTALAGDYSTKKLIEKIRNLIH